MIGPIVNNAFHSQMRAIDFEHKCIHEISNNQLIVFRESMNENTKWTKYESFNIFESQLSDLYEMLHFIKFHFRIAVEKNLYSLPELKLHQEAILMLENEINSRQNGIKSSLEFILLRLIKDKEQELEYLSSELEKLRK